MVKKGGMNMWKCRFCGGTEFYETVDGGSQRSVFDKEGYCIEVYDQELEYEGVCCCKCDNSGYSIQNIAEWEEENKNVEM